MTCEKVKTVTHFGIERSASMLIVALADPFLGTLSDCLNRRIPLLWLSVFTRAAINVLIGTLGDRTRFATSSNAFARADPLFSSNPFKRPNVCDI